MGFQIVFCLLLVTNYAISAHIPEVHEEHFKHDNYNPTVFNYKEYQKAIQQHDPQKLRYQQQQFVDKSNINERHAKRMNEASYEQNLALDKVKIPSQSAWKVIHPKFVNENQHDDLPYVPVKITDRSNEKISLEDVDSDQIHTTPKSRITKKSLKPNDGRFLNRQDSYADKKVYQQNVGGFVGNQEQLKALNALLGQTPNVQLQGLQELLKARSKDHTPIKEDVVDVPNTQSKPNIKVQHESALDRAIKSLSKNGRTGSIQNLQAQLDATANAHAESIIAQAQQKALEHVKAQHVAIQRAQAEAEKDALLQIKIQNEALARAHAEAELKARREEEEREDALIQAKKEKEEERDRERQREASERKRLGEIARERARAAALAFKLRQDREKSRVQEEESKEDDAYSVAEKTRANTKSKLAKKVKHVNPETSETQNHYVAHQAPQVQSRPEPKIHRQELVHRREPIHQESQHHEEADVTKYYVPPQITVKDGKNEHGEHELQYAANYAFGYRIRDYHQGNDFGHEESKEGHTTKGHYHVLLPDGRVQNVQYYVDPSGYHAEVSYEGSSEEHRSH